MHHIKFIRENAAAFDGALEKRGLSPQSQIILDLDTQHRSLINEIQKLQERRNQVAKEMGVQRQKGLAAEVFKNEGSQIKDRLISLEEQENTLKNKIHHYLITLPNILDDTVPLGKDSDYNHVIRIWREPKKFLFQPKEHYELGEKWGLMDFETASHISGSRFVVLKGALASLERALAQFMLDLHVTEFGYEEILPPLLVKDQTMFGTGQLPKFTEDSFKTENHWLIPTAEVPVTSLVSDKIMDEHILPLRMVSYTPCFRSEAGSAGKDTRGMLRQHQFSKVELVSITTPETSEAEHERMTSAAEEVLKRLELPYRVMLLCSGDTGFNSERTYDLEVWLPGQNAYREISSCSNCGPFQARRMNARYRSEKDGKSKLQFVHTLNGSGLAVGRTLIAVLENYQQEDGSVSIPHVLRPYMRGLEKIQ